MARVRDLLLQDGIAEVAAPWSSEEIAGINRVLDQQLRPLEGERRAYVYADDLLELGLWETVFTERVLRVLFAIMPDPVLYHAHVYEIAANDTRPHIFGDTLCGWHRDPDGGRTLREPTHVSLFVYLTAVGPEDGAFEFVPNCSTREWLGARAPFVSVTGPAGTSFAWSRSYFHRASPNRGGVRRRLLKISIQRNAYPSAHLGSSHFRRVLDGVPPGDPRMDLLLGRFQGRPAPVLPAGGEVDARAMPANARLALPAARVLQAQVGEKTRTVLHRLRRQPVAQAAYD